MEMTSKAAMVVKAEVAAEDMEGSKTAMEVADDKITMEEAEAEVEADMVAEKTQDDETMIPTGRAGGMEAATKDTVAVAAVDRNMEETHMEGAGAATGVLRVAVTTTSPVAMATAVVMVDKTTLADMVVVVAAAVALEVTAVVQISTLTRSCNTRPVVATKTRTYSPQPWGF